MMLWNDAKETSPCQYDVAIKPTDPEIAVDRSGMGWARI